jgi:hypothetical protein
VNIQAQIERLRDASKWRRNLTGGAVTQAIYPVTRAQTGNALPPDPQG